MVAEYLAQTAQGSGSSETWMAAATAIMGILALVQIGDRFWKKTKGGIATDRSADHLTDSIANLTDNVNQLTQAARTEHEVARMRHEEILRTLGRKQ